LDRAYSICRMFNDISSNVAELEERLLSLKSTKRASVSLKGKNYQKSLNFFARQIFQFISINLIFPRVLILARFHGFDPSRIVGQQPCY
jgi:hypothetical protein